MKNHVLLLYQYDITGTDVYVDKVWLSYRSQLLDTRYGMYAFLVYIDRSSLSILLFNTGSNRRNFIDTLF